jgi:hypothetical protein
VIVRKNSLKQVIWVTTALAVVFAPSAGSATKPIAVKGFVELSKDISAEGMVVTSKAIVAYSNTVGASSDIKVKAIDFSGAEIWSKTIDSGWDEVATAISVDAQGSIWFAGNSATAAALETITATTGALNPDSITAESVANLRPDMKNIALWQFSPSGDLISQVSVALGQPAIIDAISANSSGVSILLARESGQSLVSVKSGIFGKELKLGTTKSKFNAIERALDGSTSVFGSSTETLGGKKLVGKVDGILLKVSKTGVISNVVRSSASKAIRDWQSSTKTLFLTGVVKSGAKVETALTKFNTSFVPTWTTRFTSTGSSLAALGASGSVFAVFEPTTLIKGVSGWKVSKGQSLVIQFDSKGAIIGAFTSALLTAPVAAGYSADGGLIVLTSAGTILRAQAR